MGKHNPKNRKPRGFRQEMERLRAERIALRIERHWAAKGVSIDTRLVPEEAAHPEDPQDPRNYQRGVGVRTNLVGGLPQ